MLFNIKVLVAVNYWAPFTKKNTKASPTTVRWLPEFAAVEYFYSKIATNLPNTSNNYIWTCLANQKEKTDCWEMFCLQLFSP